MHHAAVGPAQERRRDATGPAVDADDHLLLLGDAGHAHRHRAHKLALEIAALDRGAHAAHAADLAQLGAGRTGQRLDLGRHHRAAVEKVRVLEQVGLVGEDLLQAQRPLLIPRARQRQRLVPAGQLQGAAARVAAEQHAERLDQDAPGVVLRLALGQVERVDLHAVAEAAQLRVVDAVAVARDLVPQLDERAHLAHLLDEAQAGVDEEADATDAAGELTGVDAAALAQEVEQPDRGGQREGQLLRRRGPGLLQVIGADVGRVPLRHPVDAVLVHLRGEPHAGRRREDVRAAGQVLLDDVVLRGAAQAALVDAALARQGDVEREQPHRGPVDRHRRVGAGQVDAVEQDAHVVERVDRHPDLADLGPGQRMVRRVAALGRQVERDRQPGLPVREVVAEELVRRPRARVPGVGAKDPRPIRRRRPVLVAQHVRVPPGRSWIGHVAAV